MKPYSQLPEILYKAHQNLKHKMISNDQQREAQLVIDYISTEFKLTRCTTCLRYFKARGIGKHSATHLQFT